MSGNYVVLILGILALVFAVYFTHTILRERAATRGDGDRPAGFQVDANSRRQVVEEVKAAGVNRALSPARLEADIEQARGAFAGAPKLQAGRCLWVDHDPDAIVHERRMVELLRVEIDVARTTNLALQFLVGRRYDFIITDLTRPIAGGSVDERAGIKLLKMLAGAPTVPPAIVYADRLENGDDAPDLDAPEGADAGDADDVGDADDAGEGDDGTAGEEASGGTDLEPSEIEVADVRLDDARTAGARAAVTTPAALLQSVLDILVTG
jgi:hypothetical protein